MANTLDEAMNIAVENDEQINSVKKSTIEIDAATRKIKIPQNEIAFGVQTDKDAERKYFRCQKIVGDNVDLSKCKIYISYVSTVSRIIKPFQDADGSYWCDDVAVDGDYITFSWKLSGNVFKEPGFVAFKVLAKKTDGDALKTRWNTAPAFGTVLLTVPDGESVEERYPDIVTQLLERMDAVEAIATEEAMQGYVNEYLGEHPVQLDKTLTDNTKAAPAGIVGELKSDLNNVDNKLSSYVIEPINLISSNNKDCVINLSQYYGNVDGLLSLKSGNFVGVLLKVKPNTKYTLTRVGYYVFGVSYDGKTILENLISWEGSTSNETITTGESTYYLAINYGTNYFTKYAMCAEGESLPDTYVAYHKEYFGDIDLNEHQISKIYGIIDKENTIITVKNDGTGDYTTIKDAVDSITDSGISKKYEIHVYTGTYDIINEMGGQTYIDSITGTEKSIDTGIKLPPYVDIIGIGEVYLTAYGKNYVPTNEFGSLFSPINLQGTNALKNLHIWVNNCRYAVHDETNGDYAFSNKTRNIIGCDIRHNGNDIVSWNSPNAYAVGFDSGDTFVFENTYMYSGAGNAVSFHDRAANVIPTTITFKGCNFDSLSTNTLKFGSVGGSYHYVTISDCYINKGISCIQESGGSYCNFIIKGNCNKEILVKYKNNVPMLQNFANIVSWDNVNFNVGNFVKNTTGSQCQVSNDVNLAVGVCIDSENKIMQQYGYISKSIFTEQSMNVGDTLCYDNGEFTINGVNKFAVYDGKFSDHLLLKLPLLS